MNRNTCQLLSGIFEPGERMRRYVQTGYGPTAKNIALVEQAEPKPGASDVVVAIHAASLNPID